MGHHNNLVTTMGKYRMNTEANTLLQPRWQRAVLLPEYGLFMALLWPSYHFIRHTVGEIKTCISKIIFVKKLQLLRFQSLDRFQRENNYTSYVWSEGIYALKKNDTLKGAIHKLCRQARGRGELPNVYARLRGGGGSHQLVYVENFGLFIFK